MTTKALSKFDIVFAYLKFSAEREPDASIENVLNDAEAFAKKIGFDDSPAPAPLMLELPALTAKESEALGVALAMQADDSEIDVPGFAEGLEKSEPTAAALLKALTEKGYLTEAKQGRKKIYTPTVAEVPEAPQ